MNRNALLSAAPPEAEMRAATPEGLRRMAQEYIALVLNAIESEGRQPDEWESHQLGTAVAAVAYSRNWLSINCTMLACADPKQRAPAPPGRAQMFTIQQLRDDLKIISGMPARQF